MVSNYLTGGKDSNEWKQIEALSWREENERHNGPSIQDTDQISQGYSKDNDSIKFMQKMEFKTKNPFDLIFFQGGHTMIASNNLTSEMLRKCNLGRQHTLPLDL